MEIREYQLGDDDKILDLFQQSFGKPLLKSFWKWRYDENPFSSSKMINLMWDGNILAGHYAVFPVEFDFSGLITLCAMSMTTMTHPDYAGKGIFKSLAEDLYRKISSEHGIEMVWGFPNNNSHGAFISSLKWSDLGIVHTLRLKQPDFNAIGRFDYAFFNEFNVLHAEKIKSNNPGTIRLNKSPDYLNWRYVKNPINNYYIIKNSAAHEDDFLVMKVFDSFEFKGKKEIDIVEHGYANNIDAISSLLGCVIKFSEDMAFDVVSINTWISLHDKRHLQLERLKFRKDCPLTYVGFRSFKQTNVAISDYSQWNLTMGDSDVY